ncbi:PAS domain-containing protein [Streptomyces sp. Ru72]|uniref:PAS domain-containing protein n=1 Tax=Streptomyces sp. Ru72 TaxID=2080747 RepID=UPI000CDDCE4B|nr:hypothetical protein C3488_15670 [Streptomyces sp. Ru72]
MAGRGGRRGAAATPVVYDTDARVQWINTAIEKQFGVTPAEVVGRFVRDILPQGSVLSEDGRQSTDVERIVEHVVRTQRARPSGPRCRWFQPRCQEPSQASNSSCSDPGALVRDCRGSGFTAAAAAWRRGGTAQQGSLSLRRLARSASQPASRLGEP